METIIQALFVSGALGYYSLNWLQNLVAYSSMMPAEHTTPVRVAFGVIIYFVFQLARRWGLPIQISAALITFFALGYAVLIWMRHRNRRGRSDFTSWEQAFTLFDAGGYLQADIFTFEGVHVASGLVNNHNALNSVPRDIALMPLPAGYPEHTTTKAASAAAQEIFLDTENRLQYYFIFYGPK
ncbi:hypothetical protein [Lacticaseibacillus songhuajiangensis]|uniref:hypothetical protein n=1 Tax=Lacticaseibacillus songhuajiangensis TaxID=1296539 RepID=UPI000F7AE272|nr:hypothetical protein [Lacticaseibacillus songhuajiangensis]